MNKRFIENVVPLVNIVALCMTEELALRKVNPIAELLEKHDVLITPFWRGKNYPLVFVRSVAALQFEEVRDIVKVHLDLQWMRPPTLLFRSR